MLQVNTVIGLVMSNVRTEFAQQNAQELQHLLKLRNQQLLPLLQPKLLPLQRLLPPLLKHQPLQQRQLPPQQQPKRQPQQQPKRQPQQQPKRQPQPQPKRQPQPQPKRQPQPQPKRQPQPQPKRQPQPQPKRRPQPKPRDRQPQPKRRPQPQPKRRPQPQPKRQPQPQPKRQPQQQPKRQPQPLQLLQPPLQLPPLQPPLIHFVLENLNETFSLEVATNILLVSMVKKEWSIAGGSSMTQPSRNVLIHVVFCVKMANSSRQQLQLQQRQRPPLSLVPPSPQLGPRPPKVFAQRAVNITFAMQKIAANLSIVKAPDQRSRHVLVSLFSM
uniref:Uncharacterized protein n=1 Tax=Clytia hemisphaerica TaxID=252671 RepID=A0A7M5X915_9CNID